MSPTEATHIAAPHIEGWVGADVHHILEFIGIYHDEIGLNGDVAEIGVHHGRLFFPLASLTRETEVAVAVDLFQNQHLNIDHSGHGDRARFETHARELFPELQPRIRIIEGDSLALRPHDFQKAMQHEGLRIVSVDGGHTHHHVINDLSLAQDLILPSGVVILDDFLAYLWPTVTEGFFRFIQGHNRRLAPFLIFQNKLFLTTISEHQGVLDSLYQYLRPKVGEKLETDWRFSTLADFKVLCCSRASQSF